MTARDNATLASAVALIVTRSTSSDIAMFEPARFHECHYLRPVGARTYQPGAERNAAPGAGNPTIPRPARAKQMPNYLDEFRMLFRPYRAPDALS
jgi:hypothetical protein